MVGGADIQNILSLKKTILKQKHLFRTKLSFNETILNAANEVIKNNTERKPKGLWTANTNGEKLSIMRP